MFKGNGQSPGTRDDTLAQYFRDISSLRTLTREEEVEFAQQTQNGDCEAMRKLVEGNLRFVVYMAARYRNSRVPLLDLINEGNIGLIKAAKRFNPNKGLKFINYAAWWVVDAIKYALAKQTGVIGLPLKHLNTVYKINRKEEELSKRLRRNPTRYEVAEALSVTQKEIEVNLNAARTPLSIDASISDDSSTSYLNTIKADSQVDDGLGAGNLRVEIESLIEVLGECERTIIKMRFGLDDHEPMTLREIGNAMGLSKSRIHQIEDRAIGQLQRVAKARTWGIV